jgi:hypothetical protein
MRVSRQFAIASLVLLACALAWASKEFTPPHASHANSYPAHDEHAQERVSVAVDPYDSAARTTSVFRTNWRENGYLPMQLVISNDSDQPIALTGVKIELVTANHSKILPATDADLYRRVASIKRRGDEPSRLPFPVPRRGPEVGVSKDTRQEVEAAQFKAVAVEPHTSQSGFVFFDVRDIREPLAGAHLYVSSVRDHNGQELMFFEIPMDKYLAAPTASK